jgi:hypothetical protein
MLNEVVVQESNHHFPYLKRSEIEVYLTHWVTAAQVSPTKLRQSKEEQKLFTIFFNLPFN